MGLLLLMDDAKQCFQIVALISKILIIIIYRLIRKVAITVLHLVAAPVQTHSGRCT